MSGWPRNWQAAVQRVLEAVLKLPEAALFAEAVPLDLVPGYREVIPHPMDLGTALGRARADAYDTPLEALADVRQVLPSSPFLAGKHYCQDSDLRGLDYQDIRHSSNNSQASASCWPGTY